MSKNNIRNFSIIAHIDHGKSTLADRFLELTSTVEVRNMHAQYLDLMDLERERGITIKMQPVRMDYTQTDAEQTRNDAEWTQTIAEKDRGLLYEDLTYKIRGAIFNVKKSLGLGHKEVIYQKAIEEEFKRAGIIFEKEKPIDISYNNQKLGVYRPDFVVDGKVVVEIKSLPFVGDREYKQLWSYLKGSSYNLGLLVNFGEELDIRRVVYESARDKKNSASSPRSSAYVLNLIDTPGHVDFSYEVSRSLAAVEGVILLVDGTKGIQAQTLAHLHQAQKLDLVVIPAINKIDLPNSRPNEIESELKSLLGETEIFRISAKDGTNIEKLLEAVIKKVPPPKESKEDFCRALVFDSNYDSYKGVVAYVRVFDGSFKSGDKIKFIAQKKEAEIMEVGYFKPQLVSQKSIKDGEIGYIATGLKDPSLVRVGDTILSLSNADLTRTDAEKFQRKSAFGLNESALALSGYKEPSPVVFASVFPKDGADFAFLKDSLLKLKLSDAALTFELDSQEVLGRGFRCGFLGSLHMEIVLERLKREYNLSLITTTPSVSYELVLKNGSVKKIFSASDLPTSDQYTEIREPWVLLTVLTPSKYLGGILEMVSKRRGIHKDTTYISENRVEILYEIPLSEIIVDFHDKLKSVSSGFASQSYEVLDLRKGDLVKLDVLVAGELVNALSRIIPRDDSSEEGRRMVEKLKELLPREWFHVILQAAIGGKIIAREDISALKKDVTGYLYGGDITRKMKLREKQKKGKKKMKERGRVNIPNSVFFELLKR
jgi:GTP-binding protein LepA